MSHIDRRGTRRQGRPLKDYSRAYKACIPCRKTKARCELAADSEPCIKCKRELKECVFTAERSTKRRATADVRGKVCIVRYCSLPRNLLIVSSDASSRTSPSGYYQESGLHTGSCAFVRANPGETSKSRTPDLLGTPTCARSTYKRRFR